ncbi:MAG: 8-oxoguanine deaminase [Chloroflexota bacterium]|jgi:cytosine/adenosine deaminase-related metal-dependent hydrolase|nr:8-oxoguanine deaminase [Chloroflexota bacterium]
MTASTILIEHLDRLVPMGDDETELSDAYVLVHDGRIGAVGTGDAGAAREGATVVDGRGLVALPGLVNTHHHFFQTVTRALPAAQDVRLLAWEATNYPYWTRIDEEAVYATAQVALGELLLSGCTTSSDQLYAFPRHTGGAVPMIGAEIEAAASLGIRIQATRGAVDVGAGDPTVRAAEFIEHTDAILQSMEALIARFHDPSDGAMVRIGLGPNGVTVCTEELMRGCVELAETHGVTLHTHVAEIPEEAEYCAEHFSMRPIERLAELGWVSPPVWMAHAVHLNDADIAMMAAGGAAVAHCPSSNMRLGSGAPPVMEMLDGGMDVGLGVDGSASNDAGNLLAEARAALLMSRLRRPDRLMTARQALRMATTGGARTLKRDDIGALAVGKQADIALFRLTGVAGAGFENDPVAGLVLSSTPRAEHVLVQGRFAVRDGHLVNQDEEQIAQRHRAVVARIVH